MYLIFCIWIQKQPACLKQLTFSGWNPPPGKRKMNGDLMYLHIITAEDKRFHLTASTRGFYVNQYKLNLLLSKVTKKIKFFLIFKLHRWYF